MDRFIDRLHSAKYTGSRSALHHFRRKIQVSVGLLSTEEFLFQDVFLGPPQHFSNPEAIESDRSYLDQWLTEKTVETAAPAAHASGSSSSSTATAATASIVKAFDPEKFAAAMRKFDAMNSKFK